VPMSAWLNLPMLIPVTTCLENLEMYTNVTNKIVECLTRNLLEPRESRMISLLGLQLHLWPRVTLTFRLDHFVVLHHGPSVQICIKISSLIFKVTDGQRNGQVENTRPPPAQRLARRRHQTGAIKRLIS